LAQFVTGNTFFVLLHEMGHVHITGWDCGPRREEDAADTFATVTMLKYRSAVTHRMLVEAAKGWFLSAWRDEKEGFTLAFYDEHGLDRQRAYWIVCLMVGSDREKFSDLAEEVRLPKRGGKPAPEITATHRVMEQGVGATPPCAGSPQDNDQRDLRQGQRQSSDLRTLIPLYSPVGDRSRARLR